MNKPDNNAECCSDLGSEGTCRNNYFDGKRLTTNSFRVEQRYNVERRHLLNRAVFGWGVVYGFAVSGDAPDRLKIDAGLALDPCGRELLQTGTAGDLLDKDGKPLDFQHVREEPCWLLSAHYAEQPAGPVKVDDSCSCEHTEWDRTCETVRYTLRPTDYRRCCRQFECKLHCECGWGRCCREHEATAPPRRGGCRCLCEHLMQLRIGEADCSLREIDDPCGKVRVDLKNGVPLACLELVDGEWQIEPCGPRRLVKRNDMLYDLIRGCDLTRIHEISWGYWHRSDELMPFHEFSKLIAPHGHGHHEHVLTDFKVTFSRAVREETVRADCFAMTITAPDPKTGWWQPFRVPIVGVKTSRQKDDPLRHVREAAIVVDRGWVNDEVRGYKSLFADSDTYVEIEVRGDFIIDCNGLAVDANAVGRSPAPTGNGTPGGTFISTFRVEKGSYRSEQQDRGGAS